MDYTQMLGNTNELKCITAFMQLGFECSIPYGNGAKYDFIADDGEHLYRMQCKSSSYVNDHGIIRTDAFSFSTVSQTTNTKETKRYTYSSKDIDYFVTCFKEKVYVVPVEECKTCKTLRLSPPSNGQNYSKAEDYLISNIFNPTEKLKNSYTKYKERLSNIGKIVEEKQNEELIDNNTPKLRSITKYYCHDCEREVSEKGCRCPECAAKASRKAERPEREKLLELIQTQSFCEIGRIYGVTDNTIRKWYKDYNLPSTKYELEEYLKNPNDFKSIKREKKTYSFEQILKIYNEGYTQKEIAQYLGCSEDTIRKHLKSNNIECRSGVVKKYGQYSLNGEFIKYFYGAQELKDWYYQKFNKELKTGVNHICDCCNGKSNQAYGYKWKYEKKIPIENII